MKCTRVRKELSAYIDGELSPRARTSIEEHLTRCPECSRRKAELVFVVESVRRAGTIEPSASFCADTVRRARTTREVPYPTPVIGRKWAFAVASCLVVGVCALGWLTISASRRGPGPADTLFYEEFAQFARALEQDGLDATVFRSVFLGIESDELIFTADPFGAPDLSGDSIGPMLDTLSEDEERELRTALLELVKEV